MTSLAPDLEAEYYRTVEEFFVSRRGDPLFLSSADWVLVHEWKTKGLPLRVVLRGIADALDSHAHSWGRGRKVGSLRYCAAEVDAARDRWDRALALGREEGVDAATSLRGFADALDAAAGLGPASATVALDLAREMRARAVAAVSSRELEPWLSGSEAALVEALGRDDGPHALARVEAAVDATLAPYRQRMPEGILAQVRAESVARRVLGDHCLPRFSLFL